MPLLSLVLLADLFWECWQLLLGTLRVWTLQSDHQVLIKESLRETANIWRSQQVSENPLQSSSSWLQSDALPARSFWKPSGTNVLVTIRGNKMVPVHWNSLIARCCTVITLPWVQCWSLLVYTKVILNPGASCVWSSGKEEFWGCLHHFLAL